MDLLLDYVNKRNRELARMQSDGKITYYHRKKFMKELFDAMREEPTLSNLEHTVSILRFDISSNLLEGGKT